MDTYSMEMIQCLIFPFENTLSQALEVFFIALLEQVNMDQAFTRRFQSLVHFPMPDKNQRLNLWEQILRGSLKPGPECDLASLADEYELSGRWMIHVLRYASLKASKKQIDYMAAGDIKDGIRKEFFK